VVVSKVESKGSPAMAGNEVNYGLIVWVILVAFFALPFVRAYKEVADHQRFIVERFGRYTHVCGPGKHFIMPFIDRVVVIDLETELPGWQGMTEGDIVARITRKRYGAAAA
jgi:regulator of protease activity HflC (stomatin/prohibitin superfamily)